MSKNKSSQIPQHIAIIMDGNRRWAKQKGLAPGEGHMKVADEMIERLAEHADNLGIKYLTLWAWSTENWNRSKVEVKLIMQLFRKMFGENIKRLHKKGVKLDFIGDLTKFDQDIQDKFQYWMDKTKDNKKITLVMALNYGGRDELVRAVSQLLEDVKAGKVKLKPQKNIHSNKKWLVTEEILAKYLDTGRFPDPELIVRTGGENRMSGFMPWAGVYSEYYFPEILMPDFDEAEFDKALDVLSSRSRRFGK